MSLNTFIKGKTIEKVITIGEFPDVLKLMFDDKTVLTVFSTMYKGLEISYDDKKKRRKKIIHTGLK